MFSFRRSHPLEHVAVEAITAIENGEGISAPALKDRCAPNTTFTSGGVGLVGMTSVQQLATWADSVRRACPDAKVKIKRVGFDKEKNTACVLATFKGTHSTSVRGIPLPSSNTIASHYAYCVQFSAATEKISAMSVYCSTCQKAARDSLFNSAFDTLTSLNCIVSDTAKHKHGGASARARKHKSTSRGPQMSLSFHEELKSNREYTRGCSEFSCRCTLWSASLSNEDDEDEDDDEKDEIGSSPPSVPLRHDTTRAQRRRLSDRGKALLRRSSFTRSEKNGHSPYDEPPSFSSPADDDEEEPPSFSSSASSSSRTTLGDAFRQRNASKEQNSQSRRTSLGEAFSRHQNEERNMSSPIGFQTKKSSIVPPRTARRKPSVPGPRGLPRRKPSIPGPRPPPRRKLSVPGPRPPPRRKQSVPGPRPPPRRKQSIPGPRPPARRKQPTTEPPSFSTVEPPSFSSRHNGEAPPLFSYGRRAPKKKAPPPPSRRKRNDTAKSHSDEDSAETPVAPPRRDFRNYS